MAEAEEDALPLLLSSDLTFALDASSEKQLFRSSWFALLQTAVHPHVVYDDADQNQRQPTSSNMACKYVVTVQHAASWLVVILGSTPGALQLLYKTFFI